MGEGRSPVVGCGFLIAVASLAVDHAHPRAQGLGSRGSRALEHRLSICGTWTLLLQSMRDLPQ